MRATSGFLQPVPVKMKARMIQKFRRIWICGITLLLIASACTASLEEIGEPATEKQTQEAMHAHETLQAQSEESAALEEQKTTPTPAFTPTPEFGIGSTLVSEKDGMTMMYVPAGEFEMGSTTETVDAVFNQCLESQIESIGDFCDGSWFEIETPLHTVYLDAYWIDQTEVTNAQYQKCVADGTCTQPSKLGSKKRNSYYGSPDFLEYPVILVGWNQAQSYCEWAGRRLPTEAEWEKAAHGTDGRTYPWGNTFYGDRLNFCDKNCEWPWKNIEWDDGYNDTAPVSNYPLGASPYGALNMGGNVAEWVADWFDATYYRNSPIENPQGPSEGIHRVYRGGTFDSKYWSTRPSQRFGFVPPDPFFWCGFRCASSP